MGKESFCDVFFTSFASATAERVSPLIKWISKGEV